MFFNIIWGKECENKTRADFYQWCPASEQQAMGTNGKTGNFVKLEISFKHKGGKVKHKYSHCEYGQTLGQVAQRGVGVSLLGDTETRWSWPWQSAAADPAWPPEMRKTFSHCLVLWFHDLLRILIYSIHCTKKLWDIKCFWWLLFRLMLYCSMK